jgi:DMSO/TMAO reductase YedYZ heme-binding membrane subunit
MMIAGVAGTPPHQHPVVHSVERMRTNPQAPTERRQDRPAPAGGPLTAAASSARSPWAMGVGGVTLALVIVAVVAAPALRFILDYGAGVLSLVSLSCAVIWGLVCTQDHLFLGPRERLMTQGIHRVLGVSSVGFLVLHVSTKVAEAHWPLIGAFVPLGVTHQDGLIALGVLAGYLMILAAVTGALRSMFAAKRHPVRWRILHATSYLAWCAALVHGLTAGRAAQPFFVWAYAFSVIGVGIGLIIRLRRLRGEALFADRRGTAAPTMDAINDSRGGGNRARRRTTARPGNSSQSGLEPAYAEPLPPMKLTPPAAAAAAPTQQVYAQAGGFDGYGTGQAPRVGGAGPMPAMGGTGQIPAMGGTGQMPAMGGGGQIPAMGGTGQIPAMGGTGQIPAMGGAGQMPAMGGGGQIPAMGGAGPMPTAQPQPQMQQQPYGYQQAPAGQPMANGQNGQAGRDGTPPWGTAAPQNGTPPWGTAAAQNGTPPWGTQVPPAPQPAAADGSGDATRLQPVSWQQANPRPYDRPYEGQR